ncbi:MAG TPA: Ig-like domain-containing protein, partial [Pyrinomonadaceae bacterium]|nr:Ig-like domain-containing protein [Pyrinomonadaceae bacterium]
TSAGPNTPSGTVTFSDGPTVISSGLLNGSGQASFSTTSLSVGPHSITASYPGDSDTLPSTSTVLTQVVNKADQFITFNALAGKTYGDAPFTVSATASSGLPVSFQILSGPATISGNTVTITGAGSVTVRASQGGDGNYNPAPDFDQSFTVAQATATVNVSGFSGAYDANPHGASGTATGVNGEDLSSLLNLGASFTNVPGGTAHWTFAGNTNYAPSSGDVAISISKASSSTTVTCPGSEIYTGSAIEPCTASYSGAGGLSGSLTPTYSNNTEVGTASASATYGGDDNHEGSTGNGSFEIEKASSTTTVTCIGSPVYTGSPITPCSVTVTGANLNLTPAPVYANNVNAGTNTASASYTFAGDANHTGSDDSKTFSIAKANATVNVSGYSGVYDGNSHGASGTATGVNGEDLISLLNLGASFTNVPGGTASWTFNAGAVNGNYNSTGGNATISITKATPEITWSNPGDIVYGTALSSTQLNATANVAGAFSYTPASGTILNAGPTQPLMAGFTPTDTTNYNATSKNVQINVLKATPSFSNLSSPTIAYGTATTNLSGKLTFGSLIPTGSVAITLNGVTQNASIQAGGTFSSSFATGSLAPGSYAISYSYGGDSNFNPANGAGTLTVGYGIVALYDQTKAHHSGSTIPIKLKITDVNGNNLSSGNTVVTAVGIALISTTAYGPVEDSGNSNPDNNFRLSGDSYIFNLKTTGLSSGVYNLYFTVGADPTLHTVQFQIS